MKVWLIIVIILAMIIAAAVIRCIYELHTLEIVRYNIHSDKIAPGDSLKAVFLSDLHGREYGEENEELVKLIENESPDIILVGGDLIVSKDPKKDGAARRFIKQISHIAPVYYAPGNHEKGMSELRQFRNRNRNYISFLKDNNINFIRNETKDINGTVSVTGLDLDYDYYRKVHPRKMTDEAMIGYLGKIDGSRYNIILAHDPSFFDEYAATESDLVLSGHYHGGSIRLPIIGGIISPQFKIFPDHSKGRFSKNGTEMIVTGGCGSHTVNLRLFNKPEIIALTFSGNEEKD